MYDAAAKQSGCVVDPPYNASYCGFNDAPGCIPLNGCGVDAVFPFFYVFMMVVWFVCLNLFVGVVLSEYQNFTTVGLTYDQAEEFEKCWSQYCDVTNTYCMGVGKLENFVAKLDSPLGFGGVSHSPEEMAARIGEKHQTGGCSIRLLVCLSACLLY